LVFIEKELEQAEEVVVAYEAGPLGYVLYRAIQAISGILVRIPANTILGRLPAIENHRP
jgi:hypothetical protein